MCEGGQEHSSTALIREGELLISASKLIRCPPLFFLTAQTNSSSSTAKEIEEVVNRYLRDSV